MVSNTDNMIDHQRLVDMIIIKVLLTEYFPISNMIFGTFLVGHTMLPRWPLVSCSKKFLYEYYHCTIAPRCNRAVLAGMGHGMTAAMFYKQCERSCACMNMYLYMWNIWSYSTTMLHRMHFLPW